ncbi:response regulator [Vreelandella massiliensis]|uniref:response regulator n=1 Tax=Vreelandella massiliensis TaxID=1816686 RepID=UPI00096A9E21|nr:response regulator [Halomonas massiliensis]MYL25111.1 response regulator [Halomonas alkaliantarctica]
MATILLIDDDDQFRYTAKQMLEIDKHRVIEATEGHEALNMLEQNARNIDMVVTDICMPGMDGTELILTLRKRYPSLPVLAISGGQRTLNSRFTLGSARMAGAEQTLAKPVSLADFRSAIRTGLQAGAS